ncbi:unnamed protein product [Cochlearia groenlandica]
MGIQELDPLAQLNLPPGFRFYPTDEELMVDYLCPKATGHDFSLQLIAEIDLYKFDAWVLPSKALFGEKEWYFFSPRDRKYPNGSRPNRVAGSGYWKATGTDKVISTEGRRVGIKKALVFYVGKAPKGTKTNWIMHEYRLFEPSRRNGSTKLDDWVLCRIYKKQTSAQKQVYNNLMTKTREYSNNGSSTSSSSHQYDDVLESLREIDDRSMGYAKAPGSSNGIKPVLTENQTGFHGLARGSSFDNWMNFGGHNSVPELGLSHNSTDSSGGTPPPPQPNLPPGFRFHPTDEELVVHYLKRKAASAPLPVSIIAEIDLYKFDPWELPSKATFGEKEWYFFSPRDRKYPKGARPNRAATSGYWKATGTDKAVIASDGSKKVGVKKALVFYKGKPPKGVKSDWIMHEFRLLDNKLTNKPPGFDFSNNQNSLRLDDWVLCRIYKKKNNNNNGGGGRHVDNDKEQDMIDYIFAKIPPSINTGLHHNNVSRSLSFFPTMLHDGDQSIYGGGGMISNVGDLNPASSSRPMMMMMANLKRDLPVSYWPVTEEEQDVSPSKPFHGGDSGGGGGGECSNILSSMTAENPPSMQQQGGVLGDGLFRTTSYQLPGLNWYSS